MGNGRDKQRARLAREAVEEDDRIGFGASQKLPNSGVAARSTAGRGDDDDDDDREANEDLSLKIVEKALLMRAARLFSEDGGGGDGEGNGVVSVETCGVGDGVGGEREREVDLGGKKRVKKVVKKVIKKVIKKKKEEVAGKTEIADQNAFVMELEDKPEAVEAVAEAAEPNPVETADNIVLRKLLRGPRYFDPPDSSWGSCYNCGKEGHAAVNCTSAKRRKPCFVCGSLEHNAKQCTKGQDCFICKKGGHRAKDCPDKYKSSSIKSKICLKCGDSGHDMFSCRNDYYHDDLKEICCYVCKRPGHLCCVNFVDSCPKEVSCYRCGQLGHTGLSCSRLNGETTGTESASSCYKCGEVGHFARECMSSAKKGKRRNREPSTPTLRPLQELKQSKGHKSAPHDLGKPHKKKKTQHKGSGVTTPRKSKHRGGWVTEDPEKSPMKSKHRGGWITEDPRDHSFDRSRKGGWRSPAAPSSMGHRISYLTPHGHIPASRYSNHNRYVYGTPDFQGPSNGFYFQNGHSGSRFGNPSNGGGSSSGRNTRNYDWW